TICNKLIKTGDLGKAKSPVLIFVLYMKIKWIRILACVYALSRVF
ncbi:MAG: hypothetical protein US22_C0020G0012, partial [candidate division TM6 bacterium GW2011_GWF2_36_6]